eukprot:c876_g1_i1.p1 GENE.c876_g1_i1~~c876_g1_i1.p1  ORF type:complete len:142 (+),score=45.52 c876_g1_i1:35-427(+)
MSSLASSKEAIEEVKSTFPDLDIEEIKAELAKAKDVEEAVENILKKQEGKEDEDGEGEVEAGEDEGDDEEVEEDENGGGSEDDDDDEEISNAASEDIDEELAGLKEDSEKAPVDPEAESRQPPAKKSKAK